ncbi:hypothetical protein GCM10022631_22130 [Deinococcus rubellus]|uniref:Uncharacterized protein n=1 Tax=Deinococcus rubellus TaxID=1889240 RepID=A0ABY5YGS7_9DEIO|nr:hypothetical protein [Deinococcus rubellus]UWX64290.1 hypothetical protein N0D28_01035 [Deinococcus rubellus]
MQIQLAHLDIQGQSCAIFAANAQDNTDSMRQSLLADLIREARQQGLRVDKAALVYQQYGNEHYYGHKDLTGYLSNNGISRWTHTITI